MKIVFLLVHEGQLDGSFQTYIRTNNSLKNSCCLIGICEALDIFYDKYNSIIEEVHKILIDEGCMGARFNRMMVLSQPGHSAEKDPRLIHVLFY